MKFTKKKVIVASIAAVAIAGAAGGAYAYWTNGGNGSGNAATTTTSAFNVVVDGSTNNDLSPDGPTDNIAYHVTNVDSGTEYATTSTAVVTGTSNVGCTASDFSVTGNTFVAGPIAAGATKDWSVNLKMIDTGLNQDACKNVTVTVKVTVA